MQCDTQAPAEEVDSTTAAGGSSLEYDVVTGTYSYVWKTDAAWAGTCRVLQLKLDDGSVHEGFFRFRK